MRFMRQHPMEGREAGAEGQGRFRRAPWLAAAALAMAFAGGCDTSTTPAGPQAEEGSEAADDPAAADQAAGGQDPALADDDAKAAYILGYRFAENAKQQFPEAVQGESFLEGVRDQLAGEDSAVAPEEADRVLRQMMEMRQAQAANQALENLEQGLAFLEKNAAREEVQVLDSGLQYEVLEEGEGKKPSATDVVTTHYEGRFIDGTVFDSSYQRGEPATFPLNGVIQGWTQGLQLMSPGAKYRLYVPSDLAYGQQGRQGIPPNSTLIFDVELLDVGVPDSSGGEAADQSGDAGSDQ